MLGRRVAVASAAVLLLACADGASPHPNLAPLWRDFVELPRERAMAVAGDPRRPRWVAGVSAGHDTVAEAEAGALRECKARRGFRRMQAECVLYAVGDDIVWKRR